MLKNKKIVICDCVSGQADLCTTFLLLQMTKRYPWTLHYMIPFKEDKNVRAQRQSDKSLIVDIMYSIFTAAVDNMCEANLICR